MLPRSKVGSFVLTSLASRCQASGQRRGCWSTLVPTLHRVASRYKRGLTTSTSTPPPQCYISHSTDPWTNLAFEEWLLRDVPEPTDKLFLYRNRPAIVLGRNQVEWTIDLLIVEALLTLHVL
ncbi:hypothetical protein BJ684DRAFT_17419 [Piptocephalis cylindrospora]|uniref:Putative lipoate-protein ligase A n=1 Tax=Piptocephalis cylindrospora TaxID=1907219 RepID=A0A4P9XZW9_9FUNG|nr:hypothetical protein BJ684DRAFT_17419 [Piptocephalis cylindrospora]|eukprot:RKP12056.1 hypothetical protein BJ684DRAFT_17419 [Piptocephalis cylindrospora]